MSLTVPRPRKPITPTTIGDRPAAPATPAALATPTASAASAASGPAGRTPARRLAWLDALRGMAALVVVFEHSIDALFPELRTTVSPKFDFGKYGVFVFFLVSGYVVPASLERGGSVRRFWIGRFFRIYPLWAVTAVIATVFCLAGVYWELPGPLGADPWSSALAHLTMLQDLLGVPNVLNVFWTLSYEMAFYLLLTALYAAGVRRPGAGLAFGLAGAAVVLGAVAPVVSAGTAGAEVREAVGGGPVLVVLVSLVLAAGLAATLSGHRWTARAGALLLAVPVLALLAGHSRIGGWQSLVVLATMFAGTALHRLEETWRAGNGKAGAGNGKAGTGRVAAIVAVAAVPVLSAGAAMWLSPRAGGALGAAEASAARWGLTTAIIAAWATFAAGLAVRNRHLPRWLPWLGVISYSVYLLHQLPLQVLRRLAGDPAGHSLPSRLAMGLCLAAIVIALSALAYRHVELPMQNLGRRVARRRDRTPAGTRGGTDEIRMEIKTAAKGRSADIMADDGRELQRL